MQICLECGKTFEENDIAYWRESRGEFWGFPAYEIVSGCPYCHGDYDEAVKCRSCDEIFASLDLDFDGLCEDCREDDEE